MTNLETTPMNVVQNSGFVWAHHDSEFMRFWKALNIVMDDRQQPEALYGEARFAFENFVVRR